MKAKRFMENAIHGFFLLMGLVTVGCVLLISVYLVVSGIPAIREIGLVKFLFGPVWNSNAAEPQFGILPFILTSIYGTAGAILLGVPVGYMTAVFLAKMAPPKLKTAVSAAVSLLAGIPSVVYGLVGMLVLVPGIRQVFHIPDGSGLLAAIIVRCLMVARKARNTTESYVCVGVAAVLIFQTISNVGMCLFVLPVIGLTLPFFSYGGSSIVTLFAAMGMVSSVQSHSLPDWLR